MAFLTNSTSEAKIVHVFYREVSTTGGIGRVLKNTFQEVMEDLKDCFMQINMYEESNFLRDSMFLFFHMSYILLRQYLK